MMTALAALELSEYHDVKQSIVLNQWHIQGSAEGA